MLYNACIWEGIKDGQHLPKSQRLSRSDWQWVVDDMVKKYGMVWLKKEQRKSIIDYLAVTFKPEKGKKRKKVW